MTGNIYLVRVFNRYEIAYNAVYYDQAHQIHILS